MTVNGHLGLCWWGLRTESRFLERVTEDEPQLIDPNPEPRDLTDGEGELGFTHATVTSPLIFLFAVSLFSVYGCPFSVCGLLAQIQILLACPEWTPRTTLMFVVPAPSHPAHDRDCAALEEQHADCTRF
jgi:hypothetical protein